MTAEEAAGARPDAGDPMLVAAVVRRLTTRLLDVQPEALGAVMGVCLGELGEVFDVDRAYVLTTEPRTLEVGMLEEWWRPGVEQIYAAAIPDLPLEAQRFWARHLRKGEAVHLPDLEAAPLDATSAVEELRKADVLSILMVPLLSSQGTVGFIGFEGRRHRYSWSDDAISLMRTVGEMLVITVDRCRAETALQQAVADLAQRNRDLERSNRDLEQFASIVSHDLKSPLMLVDGYVDLLDKGAGHDDPATMTLYAAAAKRGVARMGRLIDDLLAYSRAGAGLGESKAVELDQLVADVVIDLEAEIAATGATVTVGPLPAIDGDRTQLRQLVQNVIANGIKFHRPEQPSHVSVTATVDGDRCVLLIADDGIGIEPARRIEVFEMFNRGPSPDAPGTGIGLAIAARVAENHGGRAWVDDNPGGGTRVFVDLPVHAG